MAIRYIAAPMMGPNAREERMREERQKTVAKSAESLSRGYLRQAAIDAALNQQRSEAAAATAQQQRDTDRQQQIDNWGQSQQEGTARAAGMAADRAQVMGMPMMEAVALMQSERGAGNAPSPGPMLELPPAGGTPGSLVGPSAPWGGPSVDTAWRAAREDDPAQLVDRANERMFSQQGRIEEERNQRVAARQAEASPSHRGLGAEFTENFAGAGGGSRPDLFRDDRREGPSAGQARMALIQDAIARIGGSGGGYGIASPEASDREDTGRASFYQPGAVEADGRTAWSGTPSPQGGMPGRYRPAIDFAGEMDDSARIERIGQPLAATSEQYSDWEGVTRSDELDTEWRKSNDSGGRGTLQEGLSAWRMASEGLGNMWFNHFISGDSGASEDVLNEFMALTELADMPTLAPDDGQQAAKRAIRSKKPANNIAPGDFDEEYGMPRGDDPRRKGGS